MELVDKKQLEGFKRLGRRIGGDPARLRLTVCLLLTGLGVFGVERPLGVRLAHARTAQLAAKKSSQMAEEVAFFTRQKAAYDPRAAVSGDITDWQNYVLEKLRCTTATLISLEPHKPLAKGVFTVLEMELVAKGSSYREFADFVDRLEHGERLVRIEKLRMEKQQTSISLTCLIRGLVKASARPAAPAEGGGPDGAARKPAPAAPAAAASAAEATSDGAPPASDEPALDDDVGRQLPDELKPTSDEDGHD